jgi:hypothetical protein
MPLSLAVGDGRKALFWSDNWFNNCHIQSFAPNLFGAVEPRVRRTQTVRDALLGRVWVCDITEATMVQVIPQYIKIWDILVDFTLSKLPNRFICKWTASGEFSSALAYRALFLGALPC